MSDDIDSGPIVGSEVAPGSKRDAACAEPGTGREKPRSANQGAVRAGLNLMAYGTEDATDYIRERETQQSHWMVRIYLAPK